MMGTLAAVLAGKKIRTFKDQYKAIVTGDIKDVDGVLKITHINVQYSLKTAQGKKERMLGKHWKITSSCAPQPRA